jgi:hypothetical protein
MNRKMASYDSKTNKYGNYNKSYADFSESSTRVLKGMLKYWKDSMPINAVAALQDVLRERKESEEV